MSLATDILKRSGLAPLSPRAKTQERAAIANRLFNYWKSPGYDDIPTKPQRRQYIWRHK